MRAFRELLSRMGIVRESTIEEEIPVTQGRGTAPRRLVLLHIPKTAGSSLNHFLVNRFPAGEVCFIKTGPNHIQASNLPDHPVSCYSGHIVYGFARSLPGNPTIFTVLRDPVERGLSAYYYFRRLSRDAIAQQMPRLLPVMDLPLEEFIHQCPDVANEAFGNLQTAMLSCMEVGRAVGLVQRANLEVARENLSNCLVGLTEQLDESLALLCQEFDWPIPDHAAEVNRTPDRPKAREMAPWVRDWLHEKTSLDRELYCHGQQLFAEWKSRLSEGSPQPTHAPPRTVRLPFDRPIPGHGWQPRETMNGVEFCFIEPDAWLACPLASARKVQVEIETLSILPPHFESPFTLHVNGKPAKLRREPTEQGAKYIGVFPGPDNPGTVRLDFHIERPVRPCDLCAESQDKRLLSLAVREVRLRAA